ncbi:MAG: carboxypeptidase regulatory-like domain-containing protein [Asgard group archaeon]|nr:carboxypeptidase regulatory-like domain-containing protein [Asgard group archaeon]
MAFTLAALKTSNIKIAGIIALIFFSILILPLKFINSNSILESNIINENKTPTTFQTKLTMKIIVDESQSKKDISPNNDLYFSPESVSPTTIIRGEIFTVTGRLIDNETAIGIPGEPIYIFWEYFNWSDYEADPSGFRSQYLIGLGSTDGDGYYDIDCLDSSHSKSTGSGITVYAVFLGNPYVGKIEDTRQYATDTIDCYAQIFMLMQVNETILREEEYVNVVAGMIFDNTSTPTPVLASEGEDITIDFLGSTTTETISGLMINTTIQIPIGTQIDAYHELRVAFNISILNLPYVVGNQISSGALVGTPAADWSNISTDIYVYAGAGITFDIIAPVPPVLGQNPEILRQNTIVNVTGVLTNAFGNPFNVTINLDVFVGGFNTISTIADVNGDFSITFQVNDSSLGVGVQEVYVDAQSGQGITAQVEYHNITIVGNSTMTTPVISGTDLALPGENVTISGNIRDIYNNDPVANMPVIAQWESFGAIYSTNTTAGGSYTFDVQVPITVNPSLPNGTIYVTSSESQYHTGSNTSIVVNVFTVLDFSITLNQTQITEGATQTTIGGNTLYTNSNFTLYLNLTDQFSRPLANRVVLTNITGIIEFTNVTDANGLTSVDIKGIQYGFTNTTYTVVLTFVDNPSSTFSFNLEISSVPEEPTTGPTSPGTTPNGGTNLFNNLSIGILISVVSIIIIVAIIYGFGRFRKKGKQIPIDAAEVLDLPTVMKMMADAERAKDFQRAVVLCYRAFELICMQDLQILNARFLSPRELGYIVTNTNRIPARDINLLVRRYEEARFSDHKIIKNAFTTSKQALENVQLALKNVPKKPK